MDHRAVSFFLWVSFLAKEKVTESPHTAFVVSMLSLTLSVPISPKPCFVTVYLNILVLRSLISLNFPKKALFHTAARFWWRFHKKCVQHFTLAHAHKRSHFFLASPSVFLCFIISTHYSTHPSFWPKTFHELISKPWKEDLDQLQVFWPVGNSVAYHQNLLACKLMTSKVVYWLLL